MSAPEVEGSSPAPAAAEDATPAEPSSSPAASGVESYQQLYEEIKAKPCRVAHIGKLYEERSADAPPLRTKPSIIDRELERVHAASTLEEIQAALEETGRNLQQLGCFSRVEMLVTEEPQVSRGKIPVMDRPLRGPRAPQHPAGHHQQCAISVMCTSGRGDGHHRVQHCPPTATRARPRPCTVSCRAGRARRVHRAD